MKIYRVKWLCNVSIRRSQDPNDVWNVKKTEMRVTPSTKSIVMIQNGILVKCTTDRNITGWQNLRPNNNYNYRQPYYQLSFGSVDDFIISGYGMRGLKNG